jgi:hypothetical protein
MAHPHPRTAERYPRWKVKQLLIKEIAYSRRQQRKAAKLHIRYRHAGRELGLQKALRLLARLELREETYRENS